MSLSPSTRIFSLRSLMPLLLLLSAAVLSNLFPISVPLVLLYLPGSVFTFLILRLYGPTWGAVSAVLASLVVPLTVGHPYAVIWYILEYAFAVWFCHSRRHNNLILGVAIYWISLGSPLVLLSFYLLGVNLEVGLLISAKNCVNGIGNATLACLISSLLPLSRWLQQGQEEPPITLAQQMFSLLLGFLILPAVIMLIAHLQGSITQMENRISQELSSKALSLVGELELLSDRSWHKAELNQGKLLLRLQDHWQKTDAQQGAWVLTLLQNDRVLISSSSKLPSGSKFNPAAGANLQPVPGGAIHRLPDATRLFMPIAARWRQSSYLLFHDIDTIPGWRLVVEKPVKPFLKDLRWAAIRIFGLLTLLTYPALVLASRVSQRIATPLDQLAKLTHDLPERLQQGQVALSWPEVRIIEIKNLINNVRGMSRSLQRNFDELKNARQNLEQRVQQRTEELHQTNRALSESEQRYYTLAESSPVGIFYVNTRGQCLYVNDRWCQLVGVTQEQALNSNWMTRVHDDDRLKVLQAWEQLVTQQDRFHLEFRINLPDSGILWVLGMATAQLDDAGRSVNFVGTLTDITERVSTEKQLRENERQMNYLAHHDPLTGLANRLLCKDRLEHAIAKARRGNNQVALLFLDLDRFKSINDSLGHDLGDELLRVVAERLSQWCRLSDTVARLGGDEFVILLEEIDNSAQVATLAKKILAELAQPIRLNGHALYVTASIGISIYPNDGDRVEKLMKCADSAMYRAKELGRNNSQFYTPDMNAHAQEMLILEHGLRKALEQDQLRLYYQPQFALQSGKLVGFEALLRWQHPQLGMLPPERLIALAEETGLIEPVGKWVLETACAQQLAWQQQGYPAVSMAVNISARQFRNTDLPRQVAETLEKTGMPAVQLQLELTESMILGNTESAIQTMQALHDMGVRLSIDDFGTGYSSLAYLKRFPIQGLKIAQTFIQDILQDPNDAAITESIIALAESLGLEVIAEGIELPGQFELLAAKGCHLGQGKLLGHPLPATEASCFFHGADQQRENTAATEQSTLT